MYASYKFGLGYVVNNWKLKAGLNMQVPIGNGA